MRYFKKTAMFALIGLFLFSFGCSKENEETPEEPAKDTTPPTILSTFPAQGATNVTRSGPYWFLFSEAMNEESVENAITIGGTGFGYFTSWSGDTLFITPTGILPAGTEQTITIGTGAEDLAGNNLESEFALTFTTTSEEDNTPPTITGTVPADGATGVPGAKDIEITFSEPMMTWETQNAVTISPEPDDIDFEWENTTLVIQHSSFGSNVSVTVTISTQAEDLAGNNLASAYSFSFTTLEDNTRPYLVSTNPPNNATNVSQNLSTITMTFSEPMDETSFDNIGPTELDARLINLVQEEPEFDPTNTTLTINLAQRLLPGCTYWVKFLNITDQAGNVIDPNPTSYSFTTAGTMTYYPFIEPNKWYYYQGEDVGTKEIENYNPSNGYFEEVERDESGIIHHKEKLRYSAANNVLYHLGVADYDDNGDFEFSMDWDSPLEYLRLPVESHLGESWSISSSGTVATAEGDSYTLTLTGTVQIDPYRTDIISEAIGATFKDCITVHLFVHIYIYDGATQIEEMNIHNISYLAPCVGSVETIDIDLIEASSDTTYIYNWETK